MHGQVRFWRASLACLAVSASGSAIAQGNARAADPHPAGATSATQDIIVTAERRSANVQKVPLSISVRSGKDLREQGRYALNQILEDVPGVSGGGSSGTGNGGSDTPETGVAIRGVPSNASAAGSILSSVPTTAVYVDDVYSGLGGNYDLDRVEVLRGPQGTLYGRSATAGVIAMHTTNPDLTRIGGFALAEFGDYSLRHITAALNLPLSSVLAVRVSGNHYERNGYDTGEGGAMHTNDGRVKLLYQPSASFSALLGAAFQDNVTHTGGDSLQLAAPDQFTKVPIDVATGHNHFRQFWANVNWDLGPVSLTYIPAYRTWYQDANILVANGPIVLAQRQYTPKDSFLTQELRIASRAGAKLVWQAGVFYYDNRINSDNTAALQSTGVLAYDAATRKNTRDLGLYAEATYPLTSRLRVSGGLRYDDTNVRSDQDYTANLNFGLTGIPGTPSFSTPVVTTTKSISGADATSTFNNVNYKARLEYDLAPSSLIYGSVSTGFLPGDVQVATGAGNQPVKLPYAEETLTSYEIGSKNRFLNGAWQINGAAFHYVYGGYQTSVNIGSPFAPSFVQITAPARMTGGEIEILVRAGHHDRGGLSGSFVDARFVDRTAAQTAIIAQTRIPYIPRTNASAFWEHGFDIVGGSSLTLKGEVIYHAAYDLSPLTSTEVSQGGETYVRAAQQWLGNININWTSADRRFSVSGYVRNVGNARTASALSILSITPLSITGYLTDPRTFGGVFAVRF